MKNYQADFIRFALTRNCLRFGNFTLKSGRESPYFFNAGLFNTGDDLRQLGEFYAAAIEQSGIEFDVLYGPAYKGIPLAATTSIALSHQQKNIAYTFNRKEIKTHGDGGQLVGAEIRDKKVLIIDDVITAGTAIGESVTILQNAGAHFVGVVVALDRQERGQGATSAIQEIEEQHNVPVISIVSFADLLNYLQAEQQTDAVALMQRYHNHYGV